MNFFITLVKNRERGRWDKYDRCELKAVRLVVERGHGTGSVDPHKPITFRPAYRRFTQWNHFFVRTQMFESRADRFLGHRLQPKTPDWFFAPAQFHEITENKFAFAARIAGVDQKIDIFSLNQSFQRVKA